MMMMMMMMMIKTGSKTSENVVELKQHSRRNSEQMCLLPFSSKSSVLTCSIQKS